MDAGEIAALIAAGAFLMLVLVLAVPILRLRHTVDAATRAINDLNDRTGPHPRQRQHHGRRTSTPRWPRCTPRSTA